MKALVPVTLPMLTTLTASKTMCGLPALAANVHPTCSGLLRIDLAERLRTFWRFRNGEQSSLSSLLIFGSRCLLHTVMLPQTTNCLCSLTYKERIVSKKCWFEQMNFERKNEPNFPGSLKRQTSVNQIQDQRDKTIFRIETDLLGQGQYLKCACFQ